MSNMLPFSQSETNIPSSYGIPTKYGYFTHVASFALYNIPGRQVLLYRF